MYLYIIEVLLLSLSILFRIPRGPIDGSATESSWKATAPAQTKSADPVARPACFPEDQCAGVVW